MATTTADPLAGPRGERAALRAAGALALVVVLGLASLLLAAKLPAFSTPLAGLAVAVALGATAWMLLSERYEWSLALLMLYLGLADGFLKLGTGVQAATLVRDILLYALVIGALVRLAVRGERVTLPPLSGWAIAWVVVVLVQIANPHNGSLLHSVASVRPHAEFVPLFFLGYLVMRSKARIRNFLLLLLLITAINGVVGLVQQNLTPDQLASWGPGYSKAIKGESSVSTRTFADEEGVERNRPFALGGDVGFGGTLGYLAVPAALALLGLRLPPRTRFAVAAMSVGVVLAVATSAARTDVIAAVIAALAFAGLTVTSRAGLRAVLGVAVGVAVAYAAIGFLSSDSESGSFSRYNSIASPGQAITTAYEYRSGVIAEVPNYVTEIPFGAGLGSKGPAGSFGGGGSGKGLDSESEPTYLLIEAGVPGLLVMLGFNLTLLVLSVVRIRGVADRETRVLLTAVAAPLFAIFATWFTGITTATSPGSPYLWFAAGTLSYWLLGDGRTAAAASTAAKAATPRIPRWSSA
jgi:hypothetical protein